MEKPSFENLKNQMIDFKAELFPSVVVGTEGEVVGEFSDNMRRTLIGRAEGLINSIDAFILNKREFHYALLSMRYELIVIKRDLAMKTPMNDRWNQFSDDEDKNMEHNDSFERGWWIDDPKLIDRKSPKSGQGFIEWMDVSFEIDILPKLKALFPDLDIVTNGSGCQYLHIFSKKFFPPGFTEREKFNKLVRSSDEEISKQGAYVIDIWFSVLDGKHYGYAVRKQYSQDPLEWQGSENEEGEAVIFDFKDKPENIARQIAKLFK